MRLVEAYGAQSRATSSLLNRCARVEVEAHNASRHDEATEGEKKARTHGNKTQPQRRYPSIALGTGGSASIHTPSHQCPTIFPGTRSTVYFVCFWIVLVIISTSEMKTEVDPACWALWPGMDLTIIFLKCISLPSFRHYPPDLGPEGGGRGHECHSSCDDDAPEVVESIPHMNRKGPSPLKTIRTSSRRLILHSMKSAWPKCHL
ncbi:hypothetical protein BDZ94DRAFT_1262322 [Collybia nuda]|uniref:Uncharacterized protein n=1 Tax=Collybia nuda TaxID=64659 RepID=A0A9P5Y4F9_9AGAR|nr:hypothetical protein BDZ94DRAFT_1262322 [Collybia nuda]